METAVHIRGVLSTVEVLEELSRCTCLVLPSYQETAPMVIQEAMASGVPVIASNICGIPYQVVDGQTGFLVPPGDVDTLADRLTRIMSDTAMRRNFGLMARKKARSEYRAEQVARKTLEVYRKVLSIKAD
jgi:glycosyltransferase involved in cell wall biosynthesis